MTRLQLLLIKVAEECNETAQRALKAAQFGMEEIENGQDLTNAQRLVGEFNDVFAMMEMVKDESFPSILSLVNPELVRIKKERVEKYLKLSQELGMVDVS